MLLLTLNLIMIKVNKKFLIRIIPLNNNNKKNWLIENKTFTFLLIDSKIEVQ